MSASSTGKVMKAWERFARANGWTVDKPKGGHWKWRGPAGQLVVTPGTPGEGRAILNIRAELRRHGLEVAR